MKTVEAGVKNKDRYTVNILKVNVTSTSMKAVLTEIDGKCDNNTFVKPFFVVSANPEIIMAAQEDEDYKRILNSADLVFADGAGLRLAGVKEIFPGRKLVRELLGKKKLKVFYLGGKFGVARQMAEKYGGEWDEGEKSIRAGEQENGRIISKINQYKPDLLLVAYGAPWQEKWIAANLPKIEAKVVMGVGGTFDYLTERVKEPPEWVSRVGFEWLWRLLHEPWRWKRQINLLRFVFKLL